MSALVEVAPVAGLALAWAVLFASGRWGDRRRARDVWGPDDVLAHRYGGARSWR